jgi:hypothetical protein
MTAIQHNIEMILKKRVRDNYNLFLFANERICQVGKEMADIKHLIENTQKLLDVQ